MDKINSNSITLVGGGPAALFMMKHIVSQNLKPEKITIIERYDRLGVGMPYGKYGSKKEHIANVSANELPELFEDVKSYISKHPADNFPEYYKNGNINEYEVLPRLFLGDYLENQFDSYIKYARKSGIIVDILLETEVTDIKPSHGDSFTVITDSEKIHTDLVVICTGHFWGKTHENSTENWYDSPYPPSKFTSENNYPAAVRGTSLTAVDAVKTISRLNGIYKENADGSLKYVLNENSPDFKIDMFSKGGYLPALRFHSEDDSFSTDWTMSLDEIFDYKKKNGGFVDLDYVFKEKFKSPLKIKDPKFYEQIKDLSIEEFVEKMMEIRKSKDSFDLFSEEFREAEKSIKKHQSISWKETLSAFSYAVNYPAKHFSAEDMIRLRKTLMPLITIIIASLPQSSYRELVALHDAKIISLICVDENSHVEPHQKSGCIYHYTDEDGNAHEKHYRLYIDAIGQQPLEFNDVPFDGLKSNGVVSPGYLSFKNFEEGKLMFEKGDPMVKEGGNNNFYMKVKGLGINDHFQAIDSFGVAKENLFIMSVPFIGGLNPDYSGLDFCDTVSEKIVNVLKNGYESVLKKASLF
ncbi:hypothetical protein ASG01_02710 [Chryseobacterium sp. Leaf180]|uniref:FAD/NAD(P)-binding protein n=1 Tax=Chryseobacterium sp. Leaf180 TaxID=1736289 RepID=UPI0006F62549|nr:FAD/NAD(P)-binding protein [Chryseobacterium sp. Leaf180]KQR94797.1 hypothetical protein ASG01_02710 [Chryseobacterium sp. Leaf180]